jgi:hypothetical protein
MADRYILIIEGGSRAGERIPIAGDRFTVGRKPGNTLVVGDASVSGNHCELLRTAEGFLLRDVGSTNGTFCGGNRISLPTTLKAGDRFALGSVPMRIEVEATAVDEIDLGDSGEPSAPASTASAARELDLVEDEPAPPPPPKKTARPAPSETTVMMSAPAESAMEVRTSPVEPVDAAELVTDLKTVERAREAAAAQVKRGRLFLVLGSVGALGALGAAGYLLFMGGGSAGSAIKSPPTVAGNLLGGPNATFEAVEEGVSARAGWLLRDATYESEGSNAVGFAFSTKKTASGARAIEARFDGPATARATSEFVSVQPGQSLQVAGQVAANRAAGMMQLIFRGRGENATRLVQAGPLAAGGGQNFTRIEGDVLVPSGVNQAALSLVATGDSGSVLFDDVELLASKNPATPVLMKREIEFESNAIDGRIRKIDRDFVRSMGIVAGSGAGRSRVWSAGRDAEGNYCLFGPQGTLGKVKLALSAAETEVSYQYTTEAATGALALTWTIDRAFAPELVVRGSKVSGRYRGEFAEAACQWIVFGEEPNRLRLAFDPPAAVRAIADSGSYRLEVDLPSSLKVNIQFSFDAEKRRALDLEQQAEAAQKASRFGEAILLRSQIINEFPFDRSLVERNEQKRDAELANGQKLAAEVERRVGDAQFFKIPQGFRDARKRAEQIAALYAGTDVAERAKAVMATVDESLAATEAELGERDALRLLTIASAFEAAHAQELSSYVREYLKKYYPGTRAAQQGAK